jgi:hypothetical protein
LKVMRDGQVCPDGVVIGINWRALDIGMSFFVPAVNLLILNKQVQTIADDKNITLKGYERIENGKLGMRFWRIL